VAQCIVTAIYTVSITIARETYRPTSVLHTGIRHKYTDTLVEIPSSGNIGRRQYWRRIRLSSKMMAKYDLLVFMLNF